MPQRKENVCYVSSVFGASLAEVSCIVRSLRFICLTEQFCALSASIHYTKRTTVEDSCYRTALQLISSVCIR